MDDWEKRAYNFAQEKHSGQMDDDGLDYFQAHILHVVKILKCVTADSNIITAAYLHDVLENTNTSLATIESEFGADVARIVNEVTRGENSGSVRHHFPRLKSRDAIILKFADRLSNISRMGSWNEKRRQRYLEKSRFWE